ncbi:MAG: glucose-6-phosphate isomerase [Aeriscardovia sp.]|nr:glucose-6-phosphate isomerase [Aeriscardovia sp.]
MALSPQSPRHLPAWEKLERYFEDAKGKTLSSWFKDPGRTEKLSFAVGDFNVDLSKNLIDPEITGIFAELANQAGIPERASAMVRGEEINVSEGRAVLHPLLRSPRGMQSGVLSGGIDALEKIQGVLERMYSFAREVRSGKIRMEGARRVKTVVNIGIGGSDLGPEMVYGALQNKSDGSLSARFISNIDPSSFIEAVRGLDPASTLFLVASKSFSTQETLSNAAQAKKWLLKGLGERGVLESEGEAVARHFAGICSMENLQKAEEFGIRPENVFEMFPFIGGRYSVDSSVGLSLVLSLGPETFERFLEGLRAVDEYFFSTSAEENAIIQMAMLNVWYADFFKAETHAILPYNDYLGRLPAYLQQLTMESNGKRVDLAGKEVDLHTGEIYWGGVGTNSQHSFFQLLHQGTHLIPADFIAFANNSNQLDEEEEEMQERLLSSFIAQSAALAFGSGEEAAAERRCPGNRPSTSIFGRVLSAYTLGELIALYEHIVFCQGVVWGINSFDQFGVELGKKLSRRIFSLLSDTDSNLSGLDSSTRRLIEWYWEHRS